MWLVCFDGVDVDCLLVLVVGEYLVCDLINMFVLDMGFVDFEVVVWVVVECYGVEVMVIVGDDLLVCNFLMIYVVGCVVV